MSKCNSCGMRECCGADMQEEIATLRATLREREAELAQARHEAFGFREEYIASQGTIHSLESTVARLRKALESVNRSIENGEGIDVNIVQEALSPSPEANSGEKPGITEQELKDRGYVDLTKLGGNDWRLQRYGECAACGGNLTADHQCHRRKSVREE